MVAQLTKRGMERLSRHEDDKSSLLVSQRRISDQSTVLLILAVELYFTRTLFKRLGAMDPVPCPV